jgi:phage terminase large subunit-like protein
MEKEVREWHARARKRAVGYGWEAQAIHAARREKAPDLERVIVAVNPAVAGEETGIIVAGRDADGDCYILANYSRTVAPRECMYAIRLAQKKYRADMIVGTVNLVGDYLGALWAWIGFPGYEAPGSRPPFKGVTVLRGIADRLKPIGTLYEQGRVHHVGAFPALERRMTGWLPGDGKPMGRLEALAVALTELTPPA